MLKVWSHISTKSIFAPQFNAQLAEAAYVIGTVQTISPFLMPIAKQARCKLLEPLFDETTYFEENVLAIFFSNSLTNGPLVRKFDFKTFVTLEISFLLMLCLL